MSPESYTLNELAKANRTTRVTLYKEIREGRLRSFKIGRSRRVAHDAWTEYLASREAEARPGG